MPKPENIEGQGFHTNPERINKKGRPVSIKTQLKELLQKDGELPIPAEQFIRMKTTADGKEFYVFKIATQNAMAARLISMAMSKTANGFKAIQLILEHFDGRPQQNIKLDATPTKIVFENVSDKVK